ncbi:hypothetical protein [Burkholderia lata]|uniref:hypothetical protein n=1 Tax=Burkholderia lata (strain ATCC 17760 / DSM 23089 / LMG 22485 / NCIMB 9086 / R18194 / 383) TaxID=482957 RepID=UPI001582DBAB|nr:hypothetical protein [Burkholderia lata]
MILVFLLNGCAGKADVNSPIRLSFEQLGAESETRRTEQGLDVRTAISITGLSLPTVAGQTIMSPGGKLPDLLAVPVAGSCSRLIVNRYDTDATADDVRTIKTKLDELLDLSVHIAALESQQQLGYLGLTAAQGASDAKETGSAAIAAAIGASGTTIDAISAAQKKIAADLDAAKQTVNANLKDVRNFSQKTGVIIARWTTSQDKTASASLGTIFGASRKASDTTTGFVVMAGIRDVSLQIGTDLITRLAVERDDPGASVDVENIFDAPYIETFSRSAKFLAYSEQLDAARALTAELRLTPQQLTSLVGSDVAKNLLLQQQITLSYISSAIISASNQGIIGNSKIEAYPYLFWPRPARAKTLDLERIRRNDGPNSTVGWKDVYSNRTTLISLKKKFEGLDAKVIERAKNDDTCWYIIPKEGAYKSVGYFDTGNWLCRPDSRQYGSKSWPEWNPVPSQCIDISADLLKKSQ